MKSIEDNVESGQADEIAQQKKAEKQAFKPNSSQLTEPTTDNAPVAKAKPGPKPKAKRGRKPKAANASKPKNKSPGVLAVDPIQVPPTPKEPQDRFSCCHTSFLDLDGFNFSYTRTNLEAGEYLFTAGCSKCKTLFTMDWLKSNKKAGEHFYVWICNKDKTLFYAPKDDGVWEEEKRCYSRYCFDCHATIAKERDEENGRSRRSRNT